MTIRGLKSMLALSCGLWAIAGNAAGEEKLVKIPLAAADHIVYTPARGVIVPKAGNLIYHGGPVIASAKVVLIFWGPSFANAASPDFQYARTLQAFRNQFGTSAEYAVLKEYGVSPSNLGSGTPDWFDTSTPPTKVTDAIVQQEVSRYLGFNAFNNSTVYEVFIPSSSYSDDGTGATSCGGPFLQYCAYHSFFTSGSNNVKYSIEPYPSCGGCQVGGWSAVQNQEHFVCHETRESVTDPDLNAWFDSSGNEADDKCAWSPPPFFGTGGFGCQYEWSNKRHMCVKS
jgi:hypothetical protein